MYINAAKRNRNSILSTLVIFKSRRPRPKIITPRINGKNWIGFVLAGLIEIPIHDTPKIRAIFDILDPITVPIAIASVPFNTDEIPTNISGAEVPTVETWTERIRDFSQMPPTITYTDENGETQTVNTSELPLPVGESITMNTINDIILSVSELYPDVIAGKRKSIDPENPGGPLRTELGALSFAPKEINEESE